MTFPLIVSHSWGDLATRSALSLSNWDWVGGELTERLIPRHNRVRMLYRLTSSLTSLLISSANMPLPTAVWPCPSMEAVSGGVHPEPVYTADRLNRPKASRRCYCIYKITVRAIGSFTVFYESMGFFVTGLTSTLDSEHLQGVLYECMLGHAGIC